MIKISNLTLLNILTKLLIIIVVTKSIALGVWWYLPSDGVELSIAKNYKPKYQRVDFKNMIETIVVKKEIVKEVVAPGINITNMILKGLYGNSSKGFAIVALKSKPRVTTLVGIGEEFSGYILKSIQLKSVTFIKNNKEYTLNLEEIDKKSSITRVQKSKKIVSKAISNSVDTQKDVSRNDISFYAKNPKQIWRDISIVEVKKAGKIYGFKIRKIKPNSKFASLGLKKGDIIIKANNVDLKSYRDAIQIYKHIDKIDTVQIVVLRNNQEMEFTYEIN